MKPIWQKLQDFQVSKGADKFTFLERLSRENDWSKGYTEKVYQEYLKFLYLAATTARPVTPSDEVDQAWHLHLCYSDSYWNDLCENILGRELHHGPTRGGKAELDKHWNQYESTLAVYRESFGEPPEDIWPHPVHRFSKKNQFIRVNLKDSFVISKKLVYTCLLLFSGSLLLSGCAREIQEFIFEDPILFFVVVIFIGVFLWVMIKGGKGGGSGGSSGCGGDGCGGGCGGD